MMKVYSTLLVGIQGWE